MTDERPWFQLTDDELLALAPDELGLRILIEMGPGSEKRVTAVYRINERRDASSEAEQAVVEAWWWLVRKGLIAPVAQNADDEYCRATRLGLDIAARPDGLARLRAGERIDIDIHPRISDNVRA